MPDTGKSARGSRREGQQSTAKPASAQTQAASAPNHASSAVLDTDSPGTDALAASKTSEAPVAAATLRDLPGKFVNSKQSARKNPSRAAAALRDIPAVASGQGKSASASGQAKSAAVNQAADRIARSSARLGRLKHDNVTVHKAIVKPAPPGKTAQTQQAPNDNARAVDAAAAKGPEVAAASGADLSALGTNQPATTAVSGACVELLQKSAVAGHLGCPKCR